MVESTKVPYVICHMVPSLDGRIVIRDWRLPRGVIATYERTARTFRADAWIVGRISMAPYVTPAPLPRAPKTPIPRTDFAAPHRSKSFAIAIDPSGKLRWSEGSLEGEHVIVVLTEAVSDRHLALLRASGVSYVFAGAETIDVKRALAKLRSLFGIERLLLEGGGGINGAFLEADAIDELSILVAPFADGSIGTPTLFDREKGPARRFRLTSMKKQPDDLVWLRYRR